MKKQLASLRNVGQAIALDTNISFFSKHFKPLGPGVLHPDPGLQDRSLRVTPLVFFCQILRLANRVSVRTKILEPAIYIGVFVLILGTVTLLTHSLLGMLDSICVNLRITADISRQISSDIEWKPSSWNHSVFTSLRSYGLCSLQLLRLECV